MTKNRTRRKFAKEFKQKADHFYERKPVVEAEESLGPDTKLLKNGETCSQNRAMIRSERMATERFWMKNMIG